MYTYKAVYDELGIDLKSLGSVRLNVGNPLVGKIDCSWLYSSQKRHWIDGLIKCHSINLKYGLLPGVREEHVNKVLSSTNVPRGVLLLDPIKIDSPYSDESYEMIACPVESKALDKMNQALSQLPNISLFPEYASYITIAFCKVGFFEQYAGKIDTSFFATVGGLDYGPMQS